MYSPNGRYIAYNATLRPMQESDLARLFVYDRTTGERRNLSEATDRSINSFEWSPDSTSLYITYENHGDVTLARLDLASARLTPLVTSGPQRRPRRSARRQVPDLLQQRYAGRTPRSSFVLICAATPKELHPRS